MKHTRGFASDNNAGVHPQIFQYMMDANQGHEVAYGDDPYTQKAVQHFKRLFGSAVEVFFTLTGTGANVLGLSKLGQSFHAVICPETAHINVDECGAPEKFTQMKLLTVPTQQGKLTIEGLQKHMHGFGFEHHAQPHILSITQATELGTLYTPEEVKALADYAHEHGMYLHMDGARISNAVAALGCDIKDFTTHAGVDVLSFGGTKNGMMYGEAVVFFQAGLADNFKYVRKQGMQLASKMRYIGAQFNGFFADDLWLKNAKHANHMAKLLEDKVRQIPGVQVTQRAEANGVFALVPGHIIPRLQEQYFFYVWDESTHEVRWMCSFDTQEEDVNEFARLLQEMINE